MTAFHDIQFPLSVALGAVGGPERRTEIVTLANGREERNSPWAGSRRRWNAGVGVRSLDDLHVLLNFFEARRGRLHGFRWRDPLDWKSSAPSQAIAPDDQPLGVGDGTATEFSLVKRYASGGEYVDRMISKPTTGSVRIAINSAEQTHGDDFTFNTLTGVVTFLTPPADGAALAAGFEFDTPARFDTDRLDISLDTFGSGDVPSIPVIEIFD